MRLARPTLDSRASERRRGRLGPALRRRWVRLRYRGTAVECPCCGREWAAFVPDWNRPDAICPGCGSHERHRTLWLYLSELLEMKARPLEGPLDNAGLLEEARPLELLHFAPEHALRTRLASVPGVRYVTCDLDPAGVDVGADITAMPFAEGSFDAIVCSHVLEHVADDRAAMGELRRALRPGGWALVMVPIDAARARTYEDPHHTTPAQRERAFWQHDHVRLYAPDIADRLRGAGLEVRVVRMADSLPAEAPRRHGLLEDELIFHCSRPPSAAG